MTYKTKLFLTFISICMLSAGLCWSIYRTTDRIAVAFASFTGDDVYTLHHLFSLRANLSEHERLMYEYYATKLRTKALVGLALIRRTLEEDITYLNRSFSDNEDFQTLRKTYSGYSEDRERLDKILNTNRTDWDAARTTLASMSEYGQEAIPAFDRIFQMVNNRSLQTQKQVETELEKISNYVFGFVFITLVSVVLVLSVTRSVLRIDAERRRLAFFPEHSPYPTFSLGYDGEIIYANPSSYRYAEKIDTDQPTILPQDIKRHIQTLVSSTERSLTIEYQLHDHIFHARFYKPVGLRHVHLYINDITEQKLAEEKLHYIAYHDAITGLPNRHSFLKDCEQWISSQGFAFSVIAIGFLKFEILARNSGQVMIDNLLGMVANRINGVLEKAADLHVQTSRLYRLDGAKYVILLRSKNENELRAITQRISENLLSEVSRPLNIKRREFYLHTAIGAIFCPDDAITADELLSGAYAAQGCLAEEYRQGYQPITPEIINAEKVWLDTEAALRRGLEKQEFLLHYQPKLHAVTNQIIGFEALVRWNRNLTGLVPPGDFIPVAEKSGLIVSLGAWVLDEACRQISAWLNTGYANFTIAVNVSKLQFEQPGFISQVEKTLVKHKLEARYLELEITESMLMDNLETNLVTLAGLRSLGVELALDDFGTGYSSLQYLRQFPVTRIKIDRSFLNNLTTDSRACSIVRGIINLSHNLDIQVIAEGIETEEQLNILRELGCDEFQGYFICRPQAPAAVITWWQERRKEGLKLISRSVSRI